jgi:hypothetical protein
MKLLQELQALANPQVTITIKSAQEEYLPFYEKKNARLKFTTAKGTNAGLVNLTVTGSRDDVINFLIKDMGIKGEDKVVFKYPELKRGVNEAAAPKKPKALEKFTNDIDTLGDGVYLIPSSAPTLLFDKTESIGGAYVAHVINDYHNAIDTDDKEELENGWHTGMPSKVLKFLKQHDKVVEISSYDGSSGERSETLLVACEHSQVEKVIDFVQDPSHYEKEDLVHFAERIAKKTNIDVEKLKKWTKTWKRPNKIYSLDVGGKKLIMIAEND